MGGAQKALLLAPGERETLVARLVRIAREVGLPVVLVGGDGTLGAQLDALPRLVDAPAGIGPLGGLSALLPRAGARPGIAIACDMPFVTAELLARLAAHPSTAPVLAVRDPEVNKWQPLFARYQPSSVLPALEAALQHGERSFQAVLARLPVEELQLSEAEHQQLRDWDTPDDVSRSR